MSSITIESNIDSNIPMSCIDDVKLPSRTVHDLNNHNFDCSIWDKLNLRDGDIIISSPAKTGTTWTSQIILQILTGGEENKMCIHDQIPFLESTNYVPQQQTLDYLEGLNTRRIMKSRLPLNAIVYNPKAFYIYVGRNGMDTTLSMFNFINNFTPEHSAKVYKTKDGTVKKPEWSKVWKRFLYEGGFPGLDFFDHVTSWFKYKDVPNILLLHYEEMQKDLKGSIQKVAQFLKSPIENDNILQQIESHCTFQWMKDHEQYFDMKSVEKGKFLNKGVSERHKNELTQEEIEEYHQVCKKRFSPETEAWINMSKYKQ